MAAFSDYQDYNITPFLLDYIHLQNHPMTINTNSIFSQFCPPQPQPPIVDASMVSLSTEDNETSVTVTRKQSSDSSTVVDSCGERFSQKQSSIDKKRRSRNGSSSNSAQSKDAGDKGRVKRQRQCNGEQKPKAGKEDQKKTANHQEPPTGYIHVRARRGQATDSHSLAERVRREKISERMKILQRLVPGCDKVTGKALMLDEIINYVQSLQNQVEFLSLKLASVNPLFYDFSMGQDSFIFRPDEPTVFADTPPSLTTTTTTTTTTNPNNSCLVDTSASFLLHQQSQRPSAFSQDNASLLWEVEEQGQKFLNPSGFSDNLCSFN